MLSLFICALHLACHVTQPMRIIRYARMRVAIMKIYMGFGSRERSFWYHLHPSCTEGSLSPFSFRQHLSSSPVNIFSLFIPTSTYLLTFLLRPAFTVLTLCSCTASFFTINMESLVSPLFSFHVYFPVNPGQ